MLPDGKDFNVSIVSSIGYFLEVVDEGGQGVGSEVQALEAVKLRVHFESLI